MVLKYTVMEEGNNNWGTLLNKYLRNEITPDEREEMERQMKSSPIKQRQFRERTDPQAFINQLKQFYYIDREKSWKDLEARLPFLQQRQVIPWHKRPAFKWTVRAAALIVFVVGLWGLKFVLSSSRLPIKSYSYIILPDGSELNLDSVSGVLYEDVDRKIWYTDGEIVIHGKEQFREQEIKDRIAVVTSPGKNIRIMLSDTSKVHLNDQSTIRIPVYFTHKRRIVELTGEGYFEVAKMQHIPFIVALNNNIAVKADGTVFNIRNYEDQEVATTLIEGKVTMAIGKDSMLLKPGQQVETINKKKFKPAAYPDTVQVLAWRANEFYFKNRDLKELMLEIGRWYGYDVAFTSQDFIKVQSSGKLKRDTKLDDLISALKNVTQNQITIKKEGKKIIVSPK